MTAPPSSAGRGDIPSLHLLRGVAALGVVVLHVSHAPHAPWPDGVEAFVRNLYLLVDLFFVMSGFIMAYVYGDQFQHSVTRTALLRFAWARVSRLVPLTWTSAVLMGIVYAVAASRGNPPTEVWPSQALGMVTFLQPLGVQSGHWVLPAWSIGVEMVLYAMFPVLALAGFARTPRMAAVGAAVASACFVLVWNERGDLDAIESGALARGLGGFLLGMGLHAVYGVPALRRHPGVLLAAGLSLFGIAAALSLDLLAIAGLVLLVAGAVHLGPRAMRLAGAPPARWLGDLSFPLYLTHWPLLVLLPNVGWHWDDRSVVIGLAQMTAYVALSLGVAALAHLAIERPARQALRRLPPFDLSPLFARRPPPGVSAP